MVTTLFAYGSFRKKQVDFILFCGHFWFKTKQNQNGMCLASPVERESRDRALILDLPHLPEKLWAPELVA